MGGGLSLAAAAAGAAVAAGAALAGAVVLRNGHLLLNDLHAAACMHQIICIRIQNNSSFRYNQSHQVVSRFAIISHNRLVN